MRVMNFQENLMGQRYLLSYDMEGATPSESNKFRNFLLENGFKHLLASTYIYDSDLDELSEVKDFLKSFVYEFKEEIVDYPYQFTKIRFAYTPCSENKYKVNTFRVI